MDMMCDQVLSSSPVHQDQEVDDLNDSYLEKLMDPAADNEVSELHPDQDHDYLIDEEVTDSAILRIRVLTLEAELRKKEGERKALEDELVETKSALHAKTEDSERLKHEVQLKQDAAEAAMARVNMLEDKNSKYCRTVKTLVADAKQKEDDHKACKKVIGEKDKLLKKAAAEKKLLAKRIEEIENSVTSENASLSDQHKAVNEKLKVKSKELKDAQNENKKAIENEKGMQEVFNDKNRKISELELALATTKSLLDYAKEIGNSKEVAKEAVEKVKEASPPKSKKCKFENTGSCNRKDSCKFVHPVAVCREFSRFGSCPKEGKCDDRHPRSVCISWRNTRYCVEGDVCRNRHPLDSHTIPQNFVDTKSLRANQVGFQPAPPCHFPAPTAPIQPSYTSQGQVYQGGQSFLDLAGAAVCGPGQSLAVHALQNCCQDQVHQNLLQPQQVGHQRHHQSRLNSWPQLRRGHGQ